MTGRSAGMRALTIWQPWADAIAYGTKRVENRTWPAPPDLTGQLIAIHAAKQADPGARLPGGRSWPSGGLPPEPARRGAVLAVARVTGCHYPGAPGAACGHGGLLCSQWAAWGQYHWLLRQVRPLPQPVPVRGARLWRLPLEAEDAVRGQLRGGQP